MELVTVLSVVLQLFSLSPPPFFFYSTLCPLSWLLPHLAQKQGKLTHQSSLCVLRPACDRAACHSEIRTEIRKT